MTPPSCVCAELGDGFFPEHVSADVRRAFRRIAEGSTAWTDVFQCDACRALWAIDRWEKHQDQTALRIERLEDASELFEERRKKLLLDARGGLTGERCIWAGCDGRRVQGVVYCLEHLWKTGARR